MQNLITTELRNFECEHNVKVLFAVESGSRAWGFASQDSDWDVRFVYIHKPEWYLSIDNKRDTIEVMLPNDLDFAGWELQKALRLFRKSNPPLLEWLGSPLVYLEQFSTTERLRRLSADYFSAKSCLHHYLNMASGNFREYLKADMVKVKKYFYVLRPILACKWIEQTDTIAPMEFQKLINSQLNDLAVKSEVLRLLERKRGGMEMDKEPKIEILNRFLEREIDYFSNIVKSVQRNDTPSTEVLDLLFRETLEEAWTP
ncbi:MAG: nucleotidyltransferase domain-containing protein [Calditrichia bacterium]